MLKFLQTRRSPTLGINISASAVNIIEFSRAGNFLCIKSQAGTALPEDCIEDNCVKNIDVLANCLKETHQQLASNNTLSALAIPDSLVHSCAIQVPIGLKEIEIEALVAIAVDKILPYTINELTHDFFIKGLSQTHTGQLDVHIVAAKIQTVNAYVEAIHKAGLRLRLVDVESLAIERAIKALTQQCETSSLKMAEFNQLVNTEKLFTNPNLQPWHKNCLSEIGLANNINLLAHDTKAQAIIIALGLVLRDKG